MPHGKRELSMYLFTKHLDFQSPIPLLHQALQMSLYDEYRAQATYQRILETFGNIAPFNRIVEAETRHINALSPLFYRYQVPIPINNWYPLVTPAITLRENCELGVAGEIQNAQMYSHLMTYMTSYTDLMQVFTQLHYASSQHHLPAFRQCVWSYALNG